MADKVEELYNAEEIVNGLKKCGISYDDAFLIINTIKLDKKIKNAEVCKFEDEKN